MAPVNLMETWTSHLKAETLSEPFLWNATFLWRGGLFSRILRGQPAGFWGHFRSP